jgi:hypothetical protein
MYDLSQLWPMSLQQLFDTLISTQLPKYVTCPNVFAGHSPKSDCEMTA